MTKKKRKKNWKKEKQHECDTSNSAIIDDKCCIIWQTQLTKNYTLNHREQGKFRAEWRKSSVVPPAIIA